MYILVGLAVGVACALIGGSGTSGMIGSGLAAGVLRIASAAGLAVAALSLSGGTAVIAAHAGFGRFAAFLLLLGQALCPVLCFLLGLTDFGHVHKTADRLSAERVLLQQAFLLWPSEA